MSNTKGPQFTEAELIILLNVNRDYLASLIKTDAPQQARGAAQATIDTIKRKLADRDFRAA